MSETRLLARGGGFRLGAAVRSQRLNVSLSWYRSLEGVRVETHHPLMNEHSFLTGGASAPKKSCAPAPPFSHAPLRTRPAGPEGCTRRRISVGMWLLVLTRWVRRCQERRCRTVKFHDGQKEAGSTDRDTALSEQR